jgi:preprotein translocase subunit SecE
MLKINSFIIESINEVRHKVKIPNYADLQKYTWGVIAGVGVFSLLVGLLSVFFKKVLHFIYSF